MTDYILWFDSLGLDDLHRVGGKNASLGEMISHLAEAGVRVPNGFATTAQAFRDFLDQTGLAERIHAKLDELDINDVDELARAGREIRQWVIDTPLQDTLRQQITEAYEKLAAEVGDELAVAVRSSATAEDLPDASFAGQQETFLNVRGLERVLVKIKEVFASLYNDRAIAYRVHHGFEHSQVYLSAGVQRMVRSDKGASGVMFTLDTESGFREVVFITSAYGLGETVVQGSVNPDEFYVYKQGLRSGHRAVLRRTLGSKANKMVYTDDPNAEETVQTLDVESADRKRFSLTDEDVEALARQGVIIEEHYGRPMDIEWAKDGVDGKLYIVQARPETVKSQAGSQIERYTLQDTSRVLAQGRAIGQRIGTGKARVIESFHEMSKVQQGDVLITEMTDPDWEPIMKRASAIVTNRGGRTCHAAIIARELGIPAVVGCDDATRAVGDGQPVTVSCAEGDTGHVYEGILNYDVQRVSTEQMPEIPVKLMMNVANPDRAFDFAHTPHHGVGLARLEFIINRMIGIHPKALLNYNAQDDALKREIDERTGGYDDPVSFYVDKLAEGISTIAASFSPEPVIVRLSDFKSNEYANLIGGAQYEPEEENPMLGFRGASRYVDDAFRDCFELECRALHKVRDDMGLSNVWVMVPFVRTVEEGKAVIAELEKNGLQRGKDDLHLIMMCELPSNCVRADDFLEHFDGFSIGSNDLTQLTLGLDRDSGTIAHLFDERDPAVKSLLSMAIQACRRHGKYVGICGQGPSDYPDLARWLLDEGIESMSLNPDTVVETWLFLAGKSL